MDIVVTVPQDRWIAWIKEGTLPFDEWDGRTEYHWFSGARGIPPVHPGDRVYVVAHGRLRGYAPLVWIDTFASVRHGPHLADIPEWWPQWARFGLVRHGDAVAITIPQPVQGFAGWRYRWWDRDAEVPFPDWIYADVHLPPHEAAQLARIVRERRGD